MRDERTAIDAVVNGWAVPAIGAHLDCRAPGGAVVATVDVRVRLDVDDVAACLWAWVQNGWYDGGLLAELAGDGETARDLIVETVANLGLNAMTDYRDELTGTPRGFNRGMDACRDAARDLFAPAAATALTLVGSAR